MTGDSCSSNSGESTTTIVCENKWLRLRSCFEMSKLKLSDTVMFRNFTLQTKLIDWMRWCWTMFLSEGTICTADLKVAWECEILLPDLDCCKLLKRLLKAPYEIYLVLLNLSKRWNWQKMTFRNYSQENCYIELQQRDKLKYLEAPALEKCSLEEICALNFEIRFPL